MAAEYLEKEGQRLRRRQPCGGENPSAGWYVTESKDEGRVAALTGLNSPATVG